MKRQHLQQIMKNAHQYRAAFAKHHKCRVCEILFSECLRLSWAKTKLETFHSQCVSIERHHRNRFAICVSTPYDVNFVDDLKTLPTDVRTWDAGNRYWVVNVRHTTEVLALIHKHFG